MRRAITCLVLFIVVSAIAMIRYVIDPECNIPMPVGVRPESQRQTIQAFIYFLKEDIIRLLLVGAVYYLQPANPLLRRLTIFIALICLGKLIDEFTNPWVPISLSEKLWIVSSAVIVLCKPAVNLWKKVRGSKIL